MALDDKTRVLILANLKVGHTPRETAEKYNVSYPTVLKLRNELIEAEEFGNIKELFNMDEAALQLMIDAVKQNLQEEGVGELITSEEVEESFNELKESLKGLNELEVEMQRAARILVRQISVVAGIAHNSDTLVNLAEALAKLQSSFFAKGTNIQIANFNGEGKKFESFLSE